MDYLWNPWRYRYIAGPRPVTACIFCDIANSTEDEANYVIHRARHNYVVLNRYPYTSGHLMVVPFAHVAGLAEAPEESSVEMMTLMRLAEECLRRVYHPDGLNMGLNIGASAGAGVAGHLHMHVLPRWSGDANFMTTVAETRILPEELSMTYQKLKEICAHW